VRRCGALNAAGSIMGMWQHRYLVLRMARRDVLGRYRGAILGALWSFINPIFMLTVYTLVFGVVFGTRWGTEVGSRFDYAIVLFAGLIVYNMFAEILSRAPHLVVGNPHYVKKVVFPLEILPLVAASSALFHALIGVGVLVVFQATLSDLPVPLTVTLVPIVLLPFLILVIGLAWILASLGVYVRDISQPINAVVTAFLFLSPILYPPEALPQEMQVAVLANPLTFIIEQVRNVAVWGKFPDLAGLALYTVASVTVWLGGLWCFQATRGGFADVL